MSFFYISRRGECAKEDDHHRGDPVFQINGKGLPERCNYHVNYVQVEKTGGFNTFLNEGQETTKSSVSFVKKN